MAIRIPAVVREALASATGLSRGGIDTLLEDISSACSGNAGAISRHIGRIVASDKDDQGRAMGIAQFAQASVLSDSALKSRLFAAFGAACVGGLALTFTALLAKIVGIALLLVAGVIVLGLLQQLIAEVVEGFRQFQI